MRFNNNKKRRRRIRGDHVNLEKKTTKTHLRPVRSGPVWSGPDLGSANCNNKDLYTISRFQPMILYIERENYKNKHVDLNESINKES